MNLKKFNLKNKNALITGAGGLLGFEHASALLEVGAYVILTDHKSKKLNKIIPNNTIAVFDVRPYRLSLYQSFCEEYDYFIPELVVQFICDCEFVATKFNFKMQ